MASKLSVKFWDYSKEGSTIAFYADDATAGNLSTLQAQNTALINALNGVSLGNIALSQFAIDIDNNGQNYPADVNAQRERKWLLRMADSVTGEAVTATIPCADLAGGLLQANSDEADMTHAAWVSLKGAIDGLYNNPETGNSLILLSARKVGRNL